MTVALYTLPIVPFLRSYRGSGDCVTSHLAHGTHQRRLLSKLPVRGVPSRVFTVSTICGAGRRGVRRMRCDWGAPLCLAPQAHSDNVSQADLCWAVLMHVHPPLLLRRSRRDWWLSIGLAISNAMWLVVPYREFFNESNVPCPAYYAVGTINTSIMPAIVAVRWVGLFVQHVRQARISAAHAAALAFHASGSGDFSGNRSDLYEPVRDASGAPTTPVPILSMGSDVGLKVTPDEANGGRMRTRTGSLDGHSMRSLALPQSFSSSTKDNAFFEWLDGVVVWLRLDLLRMQVALIALLSLPHFLFYFVRLSWHPDYYDPSRVGCMNDAMVCSVGTGL